MGNAVMNREYPDQKQRAGVCYTQWRRKETAKFKCKDCEHLTDNEDSEDLACPECGGELEEMARRVDGFESPEPGNIPERAKRILAETYASCRKRWVKDHPGDKENKENKASCARIAWHAVENAGYSRAKNKLEIKKLRNVEIMETGNWKGHPYTEKDLDEAVTNFNNGVLEPYVNIDHNDKLTDTMRRQLNVMSMGFVSGLKRTGKKLFADFKQVPRLIAELIQAGALKKRSVEWWRQYKHANGKVLKNVLEAVTFHGANGVPAVNTLADIVKIYKAEFNKPDGEGEKIRIDFQNDDEEDLQVGEIKIDQAKYDELMANQRTEKDNEALSKMKADKVESDKKAEESEAAKLKAEKEAADAKKELKDKEATELKAEANGFIDKIIKDKKLLPKYKDMKITEYIRLKKDDAETLKLFKEQMETSDEILNFGTITKDGGTGPITFKSEESDIKGDPTARAEETIQAIMKKDGCTWEEAAKKANIPGFEEGGNE